jgi:hypothetical protein
MSDHRRRPAVEEPADRLGWENSATRPNDLDADRPPALHGARAACRVAVLGTLCDLCVIEQPPAITASPHRHCFPSNALPRSGSWSARSGLDLRESTLKR